MNNVMAANSTELKLYIRKVIESETMVTGQFFQSTHVQETNRVNILIKTIIFFNIFSFCLG